MPFVSRDATKTLYLTAAKSKGALHAFPYIVPDQIRHYVYFDKPLPRPTPFPQLPLLFAVDGAVGWGHGWRLQPGRTCQRCLIHRQRIAFCRAYKRRWYGLTGITEKQWMAVVVPYLEKLDVDPMAITNWNSFYIGPKDVEWKLRCLRITESSPHEDICSRLDATWQNLVQCVTHIEFEKGNRVSWYFRLLMNLQSIQCITIEEKAWYLEATSVVPPNLRKIIVANFTCVRNWKHLRTLQQIVITKPFHLKAFVKFAPQIAMLPTLTTLSLQMPGTYNYEPYELQFCTAARLLFDQVPSLQIIDIRISIPTHSVRLSRDG